MTTTSADYRRGYYHGMIDFQQNRGMRPSERAMHYTVTIEGEFLDGYQAGWSMAVHDWHTHRTSVAVGV